jgi:hypothetical protein
MGLGGKVTQLISDVEVAKDKTMRPPVPHTSACQMLNFWRHPSQRGGWEVRRVSSPPERQSVTELRGGEFCAVDCRWLHQGQPLASLLLDLERLSSNCQRSDLRSRTSSQSHALLGCEV